MNAFSEYPAIVLVLSILEEVLRVLGTLVAVGFAILWLRSFHRRSELEQPLALLIQKETRICCPITSYETAVGRARSSDIVLNFPSISRNHAVISLRKEGWRICDTHSKAGIYINGEKVNGVSPLVYGDVISFGELEYAFCDRIID